jgi:hypothetical protein
LPTRELFDEITGILSISPLARLKKNDCSFVLDDSVFGQSFPYRGGIEKPYKLWVTISSCGRDAAIMKGE